MWRLDLQDCVVGVAPVDVVCVDWLLAVGIKDGVVLWDSSKQMVQHNIEPK